MKSSSTTLTVHHFLLTLDSTGKTIREYTGFVAGIYYPQLWIFKINGIEKTENISTQQNVIAINTNLYIVSITEIKSTVNDVVCSKCTIQILHVGHTLLREF